jgi:hypothetical protein
MIQKQWLALLGFGFLGMLVFHALSHPNLQRCKELALELYSRQQIALGHRQTLPLSTEQIKREQKALDCKVQVGD